MSYEERKSLNRDEELVFQEVLNHMDRTISELLPRLSDLRRERIGDGFIVRFSKKDFRHAITLKFVQLTSNLRAGKLLIDHGFVYEWSVMQRLLDESIENILVFFYENQADDQSTLHERLLKEFYTEDLDDKGNLQGKRIDTVKRENVRKFVSGVHKDINRRGKKEMLLLDKENLMGLYRHGSGYVHGRVAHIMSLYDSERNRFCTNGIGYEEGLALKRKDFWLTAGVAIVCSILVREEWGADEEYLSNAFRVLGSLLKITGWAG